MELELTTNNPSNPPFDIEGDSDFTRGWKLPGLLNLLWAVSKALNAPILDIQSKSRKREFCEARHMVAKVAFDKYPLNRGATRKLLTGLFTYHRSTAYNDEVAAQDMIDTDPVYAKIYQHLITQ